MTTENSKNSTTEKSEEQKYQEELQEVRDDPRFHPDFLKGSRTSVSRINRMQHDVLQKMVKEYEMLEVVLKYAPITEHLKIIGKLSDINKELFQNILFEMDRSIKTHRANSRAIKNENKLLEEENKELKRQLNKRDKTINKQEQEIKEQEEQTAPFFDETPMPVEEEEPNFDEFPPMEFEDEDDGEPFDMDLSEFEDEEYGDNVTPLTEDDF